MKARFNRVILAAVLSMVPMLALITPTAVASPPCPCSIWSTNPAPSSFANGTALELGVKFKADTDGYIQGIKFWKSGSMGGTHTGNLWQSTNTGAPLASVTFDSETSSGWQTATFSSPVAVTAGTLYLASYYAADGNYVATSGYFNGVTVSNSPLTAYAKNNSNNTDAYGSGNGVYRSGASGYPNATPNGNNYWVDVIFTASPTPDTSPPTVVSTQPDDNTGATTASTPTITFSEAMDPATITTSTVLLKDFVDAPVPATVAYNTVTRTATITPSSALTNAAAYTLVAESGASGVKDLSGNALAADYTRAFTVGAGPYHIFNSFTQAGSMARNDGTPLELGVKFRSDQAGYITGVKFYKPGTSTITNHVGHLWDEYGNQLASVTFSGETASGWQWASFANPVAVAANTMYVVSYFASDGIYISTSNAFQTAGVDNAPLHAYQDGGSTPADGYGSVRNGVFMNGYSSYPAKSFSQANYWVDVTLAGTSSDTAAPTVALSQPTAGNYGVSRSKPLTAKFNEQMLAGSITTSSVTVKDGANAVAAASVSYDSSTSTVSLQPSSPLAANTSYTLTLKGGAGGVTDLAGNALAADYTVGFTTGAPPTSMNSGPGGPILVITSSGNAFTKYYAEILRAEGLNQFDMVDIAAVTSGTLVSHKVAILGDTSLSAGQVTMLTTWVNGGGHLIAMHPDKQLAGLLGLTDVSAILSEAYLKVDTSVAPGQGIVNSSIQFHGAADRYSLNGATAVADLYSNSSTATTSPAVTTRAYGAGTAGAFTYDLAKSIIQQRQGNPAWVGQERDGDTTKRPNDLFYGAKSGDVQPDWVDLAKVGIPQADEQQRLLVNMIEHAVSATQPLPRFWYFPQGFKAMIVMTGDDHTTTGGTALNMNRLWSMSNSNCSVADYQCARGSSFMYANTPLNPAQAVMFQKQGFEFGNHPSSNCNDRSAAGLESDYTADLGAFVTAFPGLPAQRTSRFHCYAWPDWASQPKTEINHGIRFDMNYDYWPASWALDRAGFMSGSGIPMRFADIDGSMIDVYQQVSDLTNQSGMSVASIEAMLDRAIGAEGYYGAIGTHYDFSDGFDVILMNAAAARSIPFVTAEHMLDWSDGRNASSFSGHSFVNGQSSFTITAGEGANGLQTMLPALSGAQPLTALTRAGTAVSYSTSTIKGISYAQFAAAPGAYVATYGAPDTTAPTTPTGLNAPVTTTSQVSLAWTASIDGTGVDHYVVQRDGVAIGLPTVASYNDTGVAPGTAYQYTVVAVDAAGNASGVSVSLPVTTPAAPDTTPPTAPTNVHTTSVTTSQVNLAWNMSTDNTGVAVYRILRDGVEIGTSGVTSFGDGTVLAGATYTYTVMAEDAAANRSQVLASLQVAVPAVPTRSIPRNGGSESLPSEPDPSESTGTEAGDAPSPAAVSLQSSESSAPTAREAETPRQAADSPAKATSGLPWSWIALVVVAVATVLTGLIYIIWRRRSML